jgi:three-Cys-motif partner protein
VNNGQGCSKKYTDREQALVKHSLLKAYLERLIMITGQRAFSRIAFVDAFAGPWQSSQEDLSDTSFALAVTVMEACRLQLQIKFRRSVRFRALFVEKDQKAYAKLKSFTDENSTSELN